MAVKTVFIMTHLGSDWQKIASAMERNPRVQVFNTGISYHHPDDVKSLTSEIHRRNNAAAIWADVICHNKDFTMKRLCKHYRFIFWSCDYDKCQKELTTQCGFSDQQAERYWSCRMAGLKQYYRRCAGSLWNPNLEDDLVFGPVFR